MSREASTHINEKAHADDPWSMLSAQVLPLFNGDEPARKIEELSQLTVACLKSGKTSTTMIPDIQELLATGTLTILGKLQSASDEKLMQKLGEIWNTFAAMTLPRLEGI
ncbi:HbrB-like protein, partial [Dimargaris cristalligena]